MAFQIHIAIEVMRSQMEQVQGGREQSGRMSLIPPVTGLLKNSLLQGHLPSTRVWFCFAPLPHPAWEECASSTVFLHNLMIYLGMQPLFSQCPFALSTFSFVLQVTTDIKRLQSWLTPSFLQRRGHPSNCSGLFQVLAYF